MSSLITSGYNPNPIQVSASTRPKLTIRMEEVYFKNIVTYVQQNIQGGGVIGIICNTIQTAMSIYGMMPKNNDTKVILTHSRFVGEDRLKVDEEVLYYCGKGQRKYRKVIVIGTQVLEQSLDIDFDLLISEIASIESFVQRMGRLHRHVRNDRPAKMRSPRLAILRQFVPQKEDTPTTGTEMVYGKWAVARAEQCFHRRRWVNLPDDIRNLVEFQPQMTPELDVFKNEYQQTVKEDQFKAHQVRIPDPEGQVMEPLHGIPRRIKLKTGLNEEEKDIARVRGNDSGPEIIAVLKNAQGKYFVPTYIVNAESTTRSVIEHKEFPVSITGVQMSKDIAEALAGATVRLPVKFADSEFIQELDKLKLNIKSSHRKQHRALLWYAHVIIFDYENNEYKAKVGTTELVYTRERGLIVKSEK